MAKLHVRGCIETIFDRIASRFGIDTKKYLRLVKSASAESEATLTRHFQFDDEEGYCSDATPIKPQRHILEQLGCDTFQGYLVSKPVPPQLFTELFLTSEKVI